MDGAFSSSLCTFSSKFFPASAISSISRAVLIVTDILYAPKISTICCKYLIDVIWFRQLSLKHLLCIIINQWLCLLMIYIKSFLYCLRFIIITKNQFLPPQVSQTPSTFGALNYMISCSTFTQARRPPIRLTIFSSGTSHRLHSQFLPSASRALLSALCLRNCSWKTIQYITILLHPAVFCLQPDHRSVHPEREVPDPYNVFAFFQLCSVFDICTENISGEMCGISYFAAIFCLCTFSCSRCTQHNNFHAFLPCLNLQQSAACNLPSLP